MKSVRVGVVSGCSCTGVEKIVFSIRRCKMVAIGREMPSVPVTGSVAESPSTTAHRVARMMQIKRRFKEPKLVGYAIEEYISSGKTL
jgi:hypothetical protein